MSNDFLEHELEMAADTVYLEMRAIIGNPFDLVDNNTELFFILYNIFMEDDEIGDENTVYDFLV
jgi:hypothetical protein